VRLMCLCGVAVVACQNCLTEKGRNKECGGQGRGGVMERLLTAKQANEAIGVPVGSLCRLAHANMILSYRACLRGRGVRFRAIEVLTALRREPTKPTIVGEEAARSTASSTIWSSSLTFPLPVLISDGLYNATVANVQKVVRFGRPINQPKEK
jgi:hypothetical protein